MAPHHRWVLDAEASDEHDLGEVAADPRDATFNPVGPSV